MVNTKNGYNEKWLILKMVNMKSGHNMTNVELTQNSDQLLLRPRQK